MITSTGYLILGLLLEAPLSGYLIRKLTLLRYRFFWSESYGQIYPQLKKLATAGLILAQTAKSGRRQTLYTLTAKGRAALADWLTATDSRDWLRLESILKIYTAAVAGSPACPANLERFEKSTAAALKDLQAMRRGLESEPDPFGNHRRIMALLDLGIATYRAWNRWAGESEILKEPDA